MPLVKGGIEGEFDGRVYPVVIGLKAGPCLLHYCGEGTTWSQNDAWLNVFEPNGTGGKNELHIPLENVAFIGAPFFVIEKSAK